MMQRAIQAQGRATVLQDGEDIIAVYRVLLVTMATIAKNSANASMAPVIMYRAIAPAMRDTRAAIVARFARPDVMVRHAVGIAPAKMPQSATLFQGVVTVLQAGWVDTAV